MNAGRIIVLVVVAAVAGVDFGSMQSVMSTSFVNRQRPKIRNRQARCFIRMALF
jgi:hypothetical protein